MKKMNKRILAMLLAIVTIVSLFPLTVFADPSAEDDIFAVRSSGAVVTSVELPQNDKVTLTADAATSYQWQILAGTTWVNIAGANGASIDLTYAMVANLLSGNSASVRCKAVVEDAEEITEPVTVSVIDPVFESKDVEINVDPVILEEAVVSQTAHQYSEEEIIKWLNIFMHRFFTQQFKRSCMPDGPKVVPVGLSPRGDLRMPSDICEI